MSSLCRGEGFLFSVPAVFLLFNLNTQTSTQLHPGKCVCVGGGAAFTAGPRGMPWESPLHLHSSGGPFSCSPHPGTLVSRAGGPGS